MKSLIPAFVFVLLFCYQTHAQTEKGRLRIGGGFSAALRKTNTDNSYPVTSISHEQKEIALSLTPTGGIFVADGFEIGISPSINWSSYKIEDDISSSTSENQGFDFMIGPYTNYFFGANEKGKPYVGLSPKIGFGARTLDYFDTEIGEMRAADATTKIISLYTTAGYAIFLNDSYILSFYIGYEFTKTNYEIQDTPYQTDTQINRLALGVAISTTFKR